MISVQDSFARIASIGKTLLNSKGLGSDMANVLEILHLDPQIAKSFITTSVGDDDVYALAAAHGFSLQEFRKLEKQLEKQGLPDTPPAEGTLKIKNPAAHRWFSFCDNQSEYKIFLTAPIILPNLRGSIGIFTLVDDEEYISTIEGLLKTISVMIAHSLKANSSITRQNVRLIEETHQLQSELRDKYGFENLIGNSNVMKQVYAQIEQVARTNATVLLRGESGTGKEVIANAIHYNSLRAKRPFIKINCAALPETLIESELFGYEKSAFTGATQRKKGRFEMADGGTLFLDEIGDLPAQTQVKLLRVLQEREFERLGGTETIRVNIRLIVATNKDLESAITEGAFREDLYYRLNVFTIFLPPLRERKVDILLLAEHFLEKYERVYEKRVRRISTPAIDMLMAYHYPGNVRELENAIERAVVACDGNVIHGHHLPPTLQTAEVSGTIANTSLESAVAALEKDLIQDALKTTRGNRAKAAAMLDTTERIINYKIGKYNINPRRFRN